MEFFIKTQETNQEEEDGQPTPGDRLPLKRIGIGAGRKTDGQVLVIADVLGFGQANFQHNRRTHVGSGESLCRRRPLQEFSGGGKCVSYGQGRTRDLSE